MGESVGVLASECVVKSESDKICHSTIIAAYHFGWEYSVCAVCVLSHPNDFQQSLIMVQKYFQSKRTHHQEVYEFYIICF